jgi:SOS response regulatory protein OraA/RecX
MNEKYIEAFKKNGFSYEEIQTIIESEKEFDKI